MTAFVGYGFQCTPIEVEALLADVSWTKAYGDLVAVHKTTTEPLVALAATVVEVSTPTSYNVINANYGYPSMGNNKAVLDALDLLAIKRFPEWFVWEKP